MRAMPTPPRDVFGIVYIVENAQQFWSELEDTLHIPDGTTLSQLDATMRRFVSFCAAYHEQYLQSPLQLEHACDLVLGSELLTFHSERMCELLVDDAQTSTDPHCQLILYNILLSYGRKNAGFLRSQKRWQPLLPLLMDNVRVDVDPDVDDVFTGSSSGASSCIPRALAVPIEAKLRSLSVRLLYEVCRVQRLSLQDLRIFDDSFLEYLFELVEQTRGSHDETFNYAVIKLIVALNEQFMVASLHPQSAQSDGKNPDQGARKQDEKNRVLRTLTSRRGSSMTFGENMIFMLNRADRTPEDLCMQLLVLKILYLLFTTKDMAEYFYTNDLCVLVDVFLREIGDIDEDNESLRHTYLRVLHPLLTKTQLRTMPYKRAQIVHTLEMLIEHETIRDVDPTTKRLVLRCLSGEWCVQFRKACAESRQDSTSEEAIRRVGPPSVASAPHSSTTFVKPLAISSDRSGSIRGRGMKASRSAETLNAQATGTNGQAKGTTRTKASPRGQHLETLRHASNDSSTSLPRVAAASPPSTTRRRDRAGSVEVDPAYDRRQYIITDARVLTQEPSEGYAPAIQVVSPMMPSEPDSPVSALSYSSTTAIHTLAYTHPHTHAHPLTHNKPATTTQRRRAPSPPKGRKRPAVPARKDSGAIFTTIAASASQPSLTTRR